MLALCTEQKQIITLKVKTEIFKIKFYLLIETDLSDISD